MDKILLTTGGTGGHIFPALAVAEEIRKRWPHAELLFIGSLYGPELRLCAQAGIPFTGLPVRGFLGRGLRAIGAGARMGVALVRAVGLVKRFRPQIVAGFGGYAAFAPMLAARLLGIPGVLHEQNAVAGASNRLLARLAKRVCLSLPDTEGFAAGKCVLTGNPVREAVAATGHRSRSSGTRRLLVMGGSQGARALNDFLPKILPDLREAGVEIRHQSGPADLERTRAAYATAGYAPECVTAFIDDMAATYAWADLALCRSGASSVAELCAAGLPAILVPFPGAIHDHQTRNAQVMENNGAARLVAEKDLQEADLQHFIPELLADTPRRAAMSAAALAAARPDAAARVVDVLAEVAGA
ncbi:MAG: undecaprenyldiphospho-muramoylpentapeptide beta-N-acetylglucosaminyltransferase [Desulfovibrionaceae bacterium]|nr:undecaprenyldiphospho-muramoylpentapeptide beta-N-acetylglucosaminyltransferase [Desulfovibrionaceae bacterium]